LTGVPPQRLLLHSKPVQLAPVGSLWE
jgi:hypothetical protein